MINIYLIFLRIGALAFGGGYAVIPLIAKYVVSENAWLSNQELLDLISISQMTPGPIAINSATFVGQKVHGIFGAILATLGVVTPQFILMMILGYFLFSKQKKFKILDNALVGIKAGVVALIFITALNLFKTSVFPEGIAISKIEIASMVTFIIGFVLYLKKVNLFKLIALGATIGVGLGFIL